MRLPPRNSENDLMTCQTILILLRGGTELTLMGNFELMRNDPLKTPSNVNGCFTKQVRRLNKCGVILKRVAIMSHPQSTQSSIEMNQSLCPSSDVNMVGALLTSHTCDENDGLCSKRVSAGSI